MTDGKGDDGRETHPAFSPSTGPHKLHGGFWLTLSSNTTWKDLRSHPRAAESESAFSQDLLVIPVRVEV